MTGSGEEDALKRTKGELRRQALQQRGVAYAKHGAEAGRALARHGTPLVLGLSGTLVSAYLPIRDELDVLPLLSRLIAGGRTIGLPVIFAREQPLVFRCWQPGEPLDAKPFGLSEPAPTAPAMLPDIILVPLAAFDATGARLGYGGGYYDRTLGLYRSKRAVIAIGIAYDEQEVAHLPRGPHDQPLDIILTPSGSRDHRS